MRTETISVLNGTGSHNGTYGLEMLQTSGENAGKNMLSAAGRLGMFSHVFVPTMKSVTNLTEKFSEGLKEAMEREGLALDPPFELSADPNQQEITVTGDRDDVEQIAELINSRSDLQQGYHNACAVARHAQAAKASLGFSQENSASDDLDSIKEKYASFFDSSSDSQEPENITMMFGEDGGTLFLDGEAFVDDIRDILV